MPGSRSTYEPGSSAARDGVRDVGGMRAALGESASAVRRFLFGMCGDWHEAEDLAQESLLKAWRKRDSFDGRANVKTWIFTIARNHWLDRLRKKRSSPRHEGMIEEMRIPSNAPQPEVVAGRGELATAVRAAVDRLPPEQREALALRESEGLTFRRIGEMLDLPAATVKSRVRYALLKLADDLKPYARELEP